MKLPAHLLHHDRIALIGMAPSGKLTIPKIAEDVPIFSIAAAYALPMPHPMTACVEVHPVWALRHPNYAPHLWEWLQRPHDFPIFTKRASKEIPASLKYPLAGITAELLAGLVRGERDAQIRYFTSSFDYLMALAIACEPNRIDIYGYDMGSDTEYRYQREGAAFWVGLARGRGISVHLDEDTPLLDSLLYAYEGTQNITRTRVLQLEKSVRRKLNRTLRAYQRDKDKSPPIAPGERPDDGQQEQINALGRVRDMYHVLSGAESALKQLKDSFSIGETGAADHEPILARQIVELQLHSVKIGEVMNMSRLNWKEGAMYDRRDRYENNRGDAGFAQVFLGELLGAIDEYAAIRDDYFTYNGAAQLLKHLIAECDLQTDQDFSPRLSFVMLDPDTSTVIGGPGAAQMAAQNGHAGGVKV